MTRPRFFTAAEVATHNTATDLWVSFLGKVCDLSPLVTRHAGERSRRAGLKPTGGLVYFFTFVYATLYHHEQPVSETN
uniref:Cytochrome b5 domain-containing protein 1 n=1 Tax=Oryzias sinensis TaxID=183150 RepID=A0A8C7WRT7_9TELE